MSLFFRANIQMEWNRYKMKLYQFQTSSFSLDISYIDSMFI